MSSLASMRGASADALGALSDDLDTALRGGADAARLGDDLFSVSQILRTEASLRRIATDISVAPAARQGLARQIFEGKLDAASLDLVANAFGRRWTATRDLADALERLSEVAAVKSAGSDSGRLADELFAVERTISDNPGLRDALSNPARSIDDKSTLVRSLLEGKTLPATITLVLQALAGTYRTVGAALTTYQKVAGDVHAQGVATVRVAKPLTDDERGRLMSALERQYGRDIHLNELVDPTVVGGLSIEIGDDVIDGTLASRLADAQRKLAG